MRNNFAKSIDFISRLRYTITVVRSYTKYTTEREDNAMARHAKRGGNQDLTLKIIVFVTAVLNLAKAVMDVIKNLTG